MRRQLRKGELAYQSQTTFLHHVVSGEHSVLQTPTRHHPCRPPTLFVAEEGSSFSTILLCQSLVAARFHVKKVLTGGSTAGLVESMFIFTFRHETPMET